MFAQLKEKLTDKLRSFGSDDLDKAVGDLVARGTAEDLIAPEWSVNLALVDMVNQNPTVMPDKLLKALRRQCAKHNAKVQILSLTILETCIKNCNPVIYSALATSELWLDLVKMTADKSVARVDADVRDKILCMIEDYAKVLPQQEFKQAYDYLLEHGVDFPVRSPDDQPPILTPPPVYQPPAVLPAGATAGMAVPVAAGAVAGHQVVPAVDPFAGMSEEDRSAVQAAMAEMEAEENAVRESAAIAASTALHQQMNQQQQQQQPAAPLAAQQQQHAAAPIPDPGPVLPENPEESLQVIANTTELLNEMLASGADPREAFMAELVGQCVRMRSKLEEMLTSLTDEGQMVAALAQHEALQAALSKYDEQLAKAEGGVMPAAAVQQPVDAASLLAAASATAAAAADGHLAAAGSAGPNFTLLGDDEDEAPVLLSSKRNPGPASAGGAAEAAADAPSSDAAAAAASPNLIDLDLLSEPVPPAAPPAAGEQPLEDMLLGLDIGAQAEAAAPEATESAAAAQEAPATVANH